jgi:hypothetical protein
LPPWAIVLVFADAGSGAEPLSQGFERQSIPRRAEAANHPDGDRRNIGMMAKFLSRMDV